MVPMPTLKLLDDTLKPYVVKTYIYLGQRYKYKPGEYIFTFKELADHLGVKLDNHSSMYDKLNNALWVLVKLKLIEFETFYDKYGSPKMQLINYNLRVDNPPKYV